MPAANQCIPLFQPGQEITVSPTAPVVGKRFVAISGNGAGDLIRVAHATAAGRAFGVVLYDQVADQPVPMLREGILPVTAVGAITAGQQVQVGAGGRAAPFAAGIAVGTATADAADAADCFVALEL